MASDLVQECSHEEMLTWSEPSSEKSQRSLGRRPRGTEGRRFTGPGDRKNGDEAGKLLSLDSLQRTVGSMVCVTQSDLYFCVQKNGLRERS